MNTYEKFLGENCYLASNTVRAQFTKTKWRRYFPQESYNVHMLDETLGIWIIFRPEMDKFSQMMRAKDGPITGEVVKVVHDDGNEEVEDEEGANDEEAYEVGIGDIGATPSLFSRVVRCFVTRSIFTE